MSATVVAPVNTRTENLRRVIAAVVLLVLLTAAYAAGRASVDAGATSPSVTKSGPAQADVNRRGAW